MSNAGLDAVRSPTLDAVGVRLWPSRASKGIIIALALVGVVIWGTLAGSMLPFIMKRLGADPAASSPPFVAALVDATGLVIYFSIAAMVLSGTLR